MDDTFRYEYDHTLIFYEPYNDYLPLKQAALLTLWDDVGLPHERQKQIFSPVIEIIGFWIDLRDMNITMSTNLKSDLVMAIRKFIDTTTSHTCALVEWQWILSWINWGLKAFPLLCPALQSSYAKITGKSQAHALIYSNRIVIQDLMWLANLMHDL